MTLKIAHHIGLGESHIGKKEETHPEGLVLDDKLNSGNSSGAMGESCCGCVLTQLARELLAEDVPLISRFIDEQQGTRLDASED